MLYRHDPKKQELGPVLPEAAPVPVHHLLEGLVETDWHVFAREAQEASDVICSQLSPSKLEHHDFDARFSDLGIFLERPVDEFSKFANQGLLSALLLMPDFSYAIRGSENMSDAAKSSAEAIENTIGSAKNLLRLMSEKPSSVGRLTQMLGAGGFRDVTDQLAPHLGVCRMLGDVLRALMLDEGFFVYLRSQERDDEGSLVDRFADALYLVHRAQLEPHILTVADLVGLGAIAGEAAVQVNRYLDKRGRSSESAVELNGRPEKRGKDDELWWVPGADIQLIDAIWLLVELDCAIAKSYDVDFYYDWKEDVYRFESEDVEALFLGENACNPSTRKVLGLNHEALGCFAESWQQALAASVFDQPAFYEVESVPALIALLLKLTLEAGEKVAVCEECGRLFVKDEGLQRACKRLNPETGRTCLREYKRKHGNRAKEMSSMINDRRRNLKKRLDRAEEAQADDVEAREYFFYLCAMRDCLRDQTERYRKVVPVATLKELWEKTLSPHKKEVLKRLQEARKGKDWTIIYKIVEDAESKHGYSIEPAEFDWESFRARFKEKEISSADDILGCIPGWKTK